MDHTTGRSFKSLREEMERDYRNLPEDQRYLDPKIRDCLKRINANLDFLIRRQNPVQPKKVPSSTLDDEHFLLLFPLKELENVIELESRLANDTSDFTKKFIAYITPVDTGHALDLKHFVRTILRTLFTYGLAGNYSWRGFRGNFQIENLKTIELIFDISKKKFKNASKPSVNVFIKEWIRYAKQRRHQLKKNNDS